MIMAGESRKRNFSTLMVFLVAAALACLIFPEIAASGAYPAWVRQYPGGGDSYWTRVSTGLDAQGNIYVTRIIGSLADWDYLIIKYNPAGRRLWVRRHTEPDNAYDETGAMSVDSKGNVYVTGRSLQEAGWVGVIIKYSTDGQRLWVRRYKGLGNQGFFPRAMALDSQGNIYITGSSLSSTSDYFVYTTVKYNSDGRRVWVGHYSGPNPYNDQATAIAVDQHNNVYVTGSSRGIGGNDFATIKYTPDGRQLWVARDASPTGDTEEPCAIAVDVQGNVSITGGKWGIARTINYGPDGQRLWSQREYLGNYGAPSSLAKDNQGNVYFTGTVFEFDPGHGCSGCYSEGLIVKYGPDGQMVWWRDIGYPRGSAGAIALDGQGNVYVTGHSDDKFAITTIKYGPEGEILWEQKHSPGFFSGARNLAVDSWENVYITGFLGIPGTISEIYTIKYVQTPRTGR
jgi:hypothetical protein